MPMRGRVLMGALGLGAAGLCAYLPGWARYVHAAYTIGGALVMVLDNLVPQPRSPT